MDIFIEDVHQDVTVGIDVYSFEIKASQPFFGIKNVPVLPKIHVIHFQQSEKGIRYGYWFETDSNAYLQFEYDSDQELFVPKRLQDDQSRSDAYYRFQQTQHLMISYPSVDEGDKWQELTKHIRWTAIKHTTSCSGEFPYVDSVITTLEENKILTKVLANRCENPEREIVVPDTEVVLNYTPIIFKSTDAIRSDHKMEDFLDKSWYLDHVILTRYHFSSFYALLGEFQWAFLNAMLFGNYGSSLQWHNILELVCFSSSVSVEHALELDDIVACQLAAVPAPYLDTLINEAIWVKCLLRSFQGARLVKATRELENIFPDELAETANTGTNCDDPSDLSTGGYNDVRDADDDSDDEDEPVVVERVYYTPV